MNEKHLPDKPYYGVTQNLLLILQWVNCLNTSLFREKRGQGGGGASSKSTVFNVIGVYKA